ncbi:MAG TPA: DUF4386 domain-containing protein, partial [Myxococcaceae bacterium]|nr:DUF4386 domain-containing protein [Myxococcaceae bacterium]
FAFLFYIAVGITQLVLSSPTRAEGVPARLALIAHHAWRIRTNVVLSLVICVTAVVLATALYAITRDEDRDLALVALAFRLGEGLLVAFGMLTSLGLLWLATDKDAVQATTLAELLIHIQGWNVTVTATLFALGSTVFSWLLLRGRMIPVPLAWLGVVASVLLVVGLPLRLVDVLSGSVTQLLWLPMAAFEIPLGFWLLLRGVRSTA